MDKTAVLHPKRILSIDAFRGIAITGMILVNAQGNFPSVYSQFRHTKWNGLTVADLVFPFFLFIMGVVIPLSLSKRLERGDSKSRIYLHIMKRSIIIFGLGLFLNAFPYLSLSIRIPGILQRIATCYFFTALIVMKMNIRWQTFIALILLVIYWLVMKFIPVPGYGAGILTKEGNLAAYVDRLIMYGHIMESTWDPEGLLSTIPAISTTLLGVLVGHLLKSSKTHMIKMTLLLIYGGVCVVGGLIIDKWFPINKWLWSSSYALVTAGIAAICLGLCYWLIDVKGYRRWSFPFVIYGTNAIAVYVLSSMVERITKIVKLTLPDGSTKQLQFFIYEKFFVPWTSPVNASFLYGITYILIWLGFAAILYHRKIFIKI
jgi:predicted acyltransferase